MTIHTTFVSIVLNEEEFIALNIKQHIDFCDRWIIVEGADRRYPREAVTADGLSTDYTAELIRSFASPKIEFVQHGWVDSKEELRSVYAERIPAATRCVIVFDADEFLEHAALTAVTNTVLAWNQPGVLRLPHIHYWKQPEQIITGGYYDVPHNRIYRWVPGSRYVRNHNHPETPAGEYLHEMKLSRYRRCLVRLSRDGQQLERVEHPGPFFHHFGFCKKADNIRDKNQFYVARGEAQTKVQTTKNRAAWFEDGVPAGCALYRWCGRLPEVFRSET